MDSRRRHGSTASADSRASGRRAPGYGREASDKSTGRTVLDVIGIAVILMLLVLGSVVLSDDKLRPKVVKAFDTLKAETVKGPLIYTGLFAAGAVMCWPEIAMAAASGYLFEFWSAVLATWVGGVIGACVVFFIGRFFLKDCVQRTVLKRSPVARHMDRAISQFGFKLVLLIRLPYVPFVWLNYVLSATSLTFAEYAGATAIGIIPGSFLYVYVGSGIKNLEAYLAGKEDVGPIPLILTISGVALAILTFVAIGCYAKKQVAKATEAANVLGQVSADDDGSDDVEERRRTAEATSLLSADGGPAQV